MSLQFLKASYSAVMALLVFALTAVFGLHHGGYYVASWAPLGAGLAALTAMIFATGVVARGQIDRLVLLALGILTAFTAWTALGVATAANEHIVREATALTAMYLCCTILGVVLSRSRSAVQVCMASIVAGSAVVAGWQVLRLHADAHTLLFDGRLIGTFGYYNSQAAFLVIAFWVSTVLAAREDKPFWERAIWCSCSALFITLAVVPQSRGALIALAGSVALYFAVSPIRVRTLPWICIPITLAAAQWKRLTSIYPATHASKNVDHAITTVQHSIVLAIVVALFAGAAVAFAGSKIRLSTQWQRRFQRTGMVTLTVCALAIGASAISQHSRIENAVNEKWDAFQKPPQLQTATNRFSSVSNNGRLELWRVARRDFNHHRINGVGAGNYESTYYRFRTSNVGFIRQPHNLTLEILAERGLVGATLLSLFFILVLVKVVMLLRGDVSRDSRALIALIATIIGYWLAHSQIEWFWQFPGVTAVVFLVVGLVLGAPWRVDESPTIGRPGKMAGVAIGAACLVAIVPQLLTDGWLTRARAALASHPTLAIRNAEKASWFDSTNAEATYISAAAWAKSAANSPSAHKHALTSLVKFQRQDPQHWRTWILSARLYRDLAEPEKEKLARATAHRLNPLQPERDFAEGAVAPGLENAP